jgi:hypothetical protein
LYQNLGVTGGIPLVLGAAYVTTATVSNFVGAILLDRVGRKPLLSKFPRPSANRQNLNLRPHTNGISRRIDGMHAFGDSRNNHDCTILWDDEQCRPFDGCFILLLFYIVLWWWH